MTLNLELPYHIENVSFAPDRITITYVDDNKIRETPKHGEIMIAEQIMFSPGIPEPALLHNLLQMICDLVDDMGTELRNPPERIR